MNIQNLLNQFTGSTNASSAVGGGLGKLTSNIPGGLAGGAAAGGIMALLVGSKSARKVAGKAAKYGGAALVGGLAWQAYKNWQQNSNAQQSAQGNGQAVNENSFISNDTLSDDFQLTLIKAMIAAAKADGHIDETEQQRIFDAVAQMDLSTELKGMVFDLLRQPIFIEELVNGARTLEQRSELYLASCLAINPDHPSEQAHLNKLAQALNLPAGLPEQIKLQSQQAMIE